ncbi:MAG: CrcB family protein [Actinomycetota bacterium]
MRTVIGISVAGSARALARFGSRGSSRSDRPRPFPWGTFVVNITGVFLLGLVFTLMTERLAVSPWLRSTLTIGFLGAYTTFSTLSLGTFRLIEDNAYVTAALNSVGSLAAGIVAVYAGVIVARVV